MRKLVRVLGASAAVAASAFIALVLTVWLGFRGSLPALDGSAPVKGLSAQVVVARDSVGAPTITAASRTDLARGLGYAHGQDRFFQMDLMRRAASGELAALLGPGLIDADRRLRVHRFRRVARAAVAALGAEHRALLNAYVEGVNAGMASLKSRPFEYWLLRSKPDPWSAEDTVLCVHSMFLQLQDPEGHVQLQRGLLRATLPESLWRFLEAGAPEWEAAVDGSGRAEPIVPAAGAVDLRSQADLPVLPPPLVLRQLNGVGSNNWAVAGTRTASGAACSSAAWQAQAWYGGDYDKLWLKTEGQRNHGATGDARAEILWDRIIAPWWNLQAGVRRDFGEGPARSWLAFGVAGLAPGRFDVEATLYAGDAGRSAARFKVEYNLLLTQRCVMQPEIESNLYGKEDPDRRMGSGLANVDIALRLRYEMRREFAPYIGVIWSRYFAGSAGFARADGLRADEWRFVSGLRVWF